MPRLTGTQFFVLLLATILLLGFGYGASIHSEAMMAVCGTGGLGAVVVAAVFLIRNDRKDPPTTGLVLLIVAGLAIAVSACGAQAKVTREVRAGDIAVTEWIAAHGCEDGRTLMEARLMVLAPVRAALTRLEAQVCTGALVQQVAGIISDALGRNVGGAVEGMFSAGCRATFAGVMAELDAGDESLATAIDDICTTEGDGS